MKFSRLFPAFTLTLLFAACEPKHDFSDYRDIPAMKWHAVDTVTFAFDLPENKSYALSVSARHRKDYEFSNLWLKVRLKGAGRDTSFRFEMQLFNNEGRPYGECSGSACTQTIPIKQLPALSKGHYEVQLVQLMRKDPLDGIQDIGVIVDTK